MCFVAEEASHELLWSGPIPVAVASSVVLLLLLLLVTPSLLLPASQDPILGSYGKARGDSHALLHRHVILNWNFRVPHPTVLFPFLLYASSVPLGCPLVLDLHACSHF